jgi:uncharacterized membrane protein
VVLGVAIKNIVIFGGFFARRKYHIIFGGFFGRQKYHVIFSG